MKLAKRVESLPPYLFAEIFVGSGLHARTAIGVPSLPDGTPVELVAYLGA